MISKRIGNEKSKIPGDASKGYFAVQFPLDSLQCLSSGNENKKKASISKAYNVEHHLHFVINFNGYSLRYEP
jgi:hypothetical protein